MAENFTWSPGDLRTVYAKRRETIEGAADWDSLVDHFPLILDELERLYRIEYCVVTALARLDDTEPRDEPGPLCGPAWSKVGYVCGLGSNSAARLCLKHGVDPNYNCANDREEEPEEEEE